MLSMPMAFICSAAFGFMLPLFIFAMSVSMRVLPSREKILLGMVVVPPALSLDWVSMVAE